MSLYAKTQIWVWDRKYKSWMQPTSETHFIAKGGRGYELTTIIKNEKLEEDSWLPVGASKSGTRFIIIPTAAITEAATAIKWIEEQTKSIASPPSQANAVKP
jgi:hypothetical protein